MIGRIRRRQRVWRKPWVLAFITWAYIAWWGFPIVVAVRASFSTTDAYLPQGFTTDWYSLVLHSPGIRVVFLRSLRLAFVTVLVATPIGAAAAIGLDRWRSRSSRAVSAMTVLVVAMPQIGIGVAYFLLFAYVATFVGLDIRAQQIAHITLAIPFVILVVRSRLLGLGREFEEMAMDLGASPWGAIRRILLPLASPALIAGAAVAFTVSFDNLVLSQSVCLRVESCATVPMKLFGSVIGDAATPDTYALATLAFAVSSVGFLIVLAAFRLTRGWSRRS